MAAALIRKASDRLKKTSSKRSSKRGNQGWSDMDKDANGVPRFIVACIEHVEKEGMATAGLYRKGANQTRITALVKTAKTNPADYGLQDCLNPLDVAAAVKMFVGSFDDAIIDLNGGVKEKFQAAKTVDELREFYNTLPEEKRKMLPFIIRHLSRVAAQHPKNVPKEAMDAANLSKIWTPNLTLAVPDTSGMKQKAMAKALQEGMALAASLEKKITMTIEHCDEIFPA